MACADWIHDMDRLFTGSCGVHLLPCPPTQGGVHSIASPGQMEPCPRDLIMPITSVLGVHVRPDPLTQPSVSNSNV